MQEPQPTPDRLLSLMSRLESLRLGRPPLGKAGLSLPQFGLLACIRRSPGIRVHQVAERLGVSKPTVSVGLRKLAEGGWLLRKPDAHDKRSIRLYLSPKANALAKQMLTHRRKAISNFMNALNAEEQDQLLTLLEKAISNLEREKQFPARNQKAIIIQGAVKHG